jgi:hypothetical protein
LQSRNIWCGSGEAATKWIAIVSRSRYILLL